jgi:hypothetical protein
MKKNDEIPSFKRQLAKYLSQVALGILILAAGIYSWQRIGNNTSWWEPNPNAPFLTYHEKRWFKSDLEVRCYWTKDADGNLGWCRKDNELGWVKFVDPGFYDDAYASGNQYE